VTVDDVERVARFYLKPDAVSVALVGNAAAFAKDLRGVGFGRFEVVPLENLDLLAVDFKRGGAALPSRIGRTGAPVLRMAAYQQPDTRTPSPSGVTPSEGDKAKALLAQVLEAKGGVAALRGVKTIKAQSKATMIGADAPGGPGKNVEAETTTYLQYPDHVRVETRGSDGSQTQVYDGERGWVRDPSGTHEVPAAALTDMADNLRRDTVAALVAADRGDLRARVLPDIKDEGGAVYHALELSSPTFEPLVLYVDPKTGLVSKQVYLVRAPGQPLIEEIFSDYRRVDGLMVAFSAEVRAAGKTVVKRRVTDISINTSLDPRLFTRPN
jgi:hypothetical protein